jgi:hypothetical protein
MKKIASLLIILLLSVVSTASAKKARKFYLTQDRFTGSQALTACAKKFHMASLWEIFDTTALQYDTQNGFVEDDSGSGPPVAVGWARTGGVGHVAATPGVGNCNAWTTDSGNGSIIFLKAPWNSVLESFGPWLFSAQSCASFFSVWCVQD